MVEIITIIIQILLIIAIFRMEMNTEEIRKMLNKLLEEKKDNEKKEEDKDKSVMW